MNTLNFLHSSQLYHQMQSVSTMSSRVKSISVASLTDSNAIWIILSRPGFIQDWAWKVYHRKGFLFFVCSHSFMGISALSSFHLNSCHKIHLSDASQDCTLISNRFLIQSFQSLLFLFYRSMSTFCFSVDNHLLVFPLCAKQIESELRIVKMFSFFFYSDKIHEEENCRFRIVPKHTMWDHVIYVCVFVCEGLRI